LLLYKENSKYICKCIVTVHWNTIAETLLSVSLCSSNILVVRYKVRIDFRLKLISLFYSKLLFSALFTVFSIDIDRNNSDFNYLVDLYLELSLFYCWKWTAVHVFTRPNLLLFVQGTNTWKLFNFSVEIVLQIWIFMAHVWHKNC